LWDLNPHAREAFFPFGRTAGFLLFAVAVLTCMTGIGLLHRKRWAWFIAVATFTVNGAGDAVTLWVTHDLLRGGAGVLIAGTFLVLLMRPAVRQSFGSNLSR
jgi:Ni,Fe-hydrogenase I cytochrome b subunit